MGVVMPWTAMKREDEASCLAPDHEVAITRRRLVPKKRYALWLDLSLCVGCSTLAEPQLRAGLADPIRLRL